MTPENVMLFVLLREVLSQQYEKGIETCNTSSCKFKVSYTESQNSLIHINLVNGPAYICALKTGDF